MSAETIVFDDWENVLRETVPPEKQGEWREAVVKFRHWLREAGKRPTVDVFKEHLAWKQSYLPPERFAVRRQALRWYWEKGEKVGRQEPGAGNPETQGGPGGQPPDEGVGSPAGHRPATNNPRPTTNNRMNDVPTKEAADLGGPVWEQKMVARIRARPWRGERRRRIGIGRGTGCGSWRIKN